MIDVQNEQILTLAEAARSLPGRPNLATLFRWRTRGVRGVKLETILSGGRRYTSVESLRRFQNRVTAVADGEPVRTETPHQRERQIELAEQRAEELGL